eukprot:TRINITY_DN12469_c0_g1_i3.p1 TRINITY_DN12469_c0_g1~~TRINITY_DN12469_c0_g1_i3.p1  ORF type:complete len:496 (+),score=113.18 TRINITY_DN12469_c0_g1_i3:265-1752(+)
MCIGAVGRQHQPEFFERMIPRKDLHGQISRAHFELTALSASGDALCLRLRSPSPGVRLWADDCPVAQGVHPAALVHHSVLAFSNFSESDQRYFLTLRVVLRSRMEVAAEDRRSPQVFRGTALGNTRPGRTPCGVGAGGTPVRPRSPVKVGGPRVALRDRLASGPGAVVAAHRQAARQGSKGSSAPHAQAASNLPGAAVAAAANAAAIATAREVPAALRRSGSAGPRAGSAGAARRRERSAAKDSAAALDVTLHEPPANTDESEAKETDEEFNATGLPDLMRQQDEELRDLEAVLQTLKAARNASSAADEEELELKRRGELMEALRKLREDPFNDFLEQLKVDFYEQQHLENLEAELAKVKAEEEQHRQEIEELRAQRLLNEQKRAEEEKENQHLARTSKQQKHELLEQEGRLRKERIVNSITGTEDYERLASCFQATFDWDAQMARLTAEAAFEEERYRRYCEQQALEAASMAEASVSATARDALIASDRDAVPS